MTFTALRYLLHNFELNNCNFSVSTYISAINHLFILDYWTFASKLGQFLAIKVPII